MSELEAAKQKVRELRSMRDDLRKEEFDLIAPYQKELRRLERKFLSRSAELNRLGHERFLVMTRIERVEFDLRRDRKKTDGLLEGRELKGKE